MKAIKSFLPVFPGFYSTVFEADETPYIEDDKTYDEYEWDYRTYERSVAIECTGAIESKLAELGICLAVVYEDLVSPREYNFTNDSINVTYKLDSKCLAAIKNYLNTNLAPFAVYIHEKYSSCSGFISFYSSDYKDWLNVLNFKSLENDAHCLGAVLDFILHNEEYTDMDLYYDSVDRFGISVMGDLKESEEV